MHYDGRQKFPPVMVALCWRLTNINYAQYSAGIICAPLVPDLLFLFLYITYQVSSRIHSNS